jgi:hypothetical protein
MIKEQNRVFVFFDRYRMYPQGQWHRQVPPLPLNVFQSVVVDLFIERIGFILLKVIYQDLYIFL